MSPEVKEPAKRTTAAVQAADGGKLTEKLRSLSSGQLSRPIEPLAIQVPCCRPARLPTCSTCCRPGRRPTWAQHWSGSARADCGNRPASCPDSDKSGVLGPFNEAPSFLTSLGF